MKIEKDGVIKELADEFMIADYINAGWKECKTINIDNYKQKSFRKAKIDKEK